MKSQLYPFAQYRDLKKSNSIDVWFINSSIGFEKIVQMLIEKGANVNAVNKENDSALISASSKGNISNQSWLIFAFHAEFFSIKKIKDEKN